MEHKQTQELKPGGYNQFCKTTEKVNRTVHWVTPNKFVWLTSTDKESPCHLSSCSAVQGGAVGTGRFAVSGTNQLLDYLEVVLLDRCFPILNYMLQAGRGAERRRLTSVPRAFFFPFTFTQSHVSIHIHHIISVFWVMGPLKSRKE